MRKTTDVPIKSRGCGCGGPHGLLEGPGGWFEGRQATLSSSFCFLAFIHQIVMVPALCWGLQSPLAPQQ